MDRPREPATLRVMSVPLTACRERKSRQDQFE